MINRRRAYISDELSWPSGPLFTLTLWSVLVAGCCRPSSHSTQIWHIQFIYFSALACDKYDDDIHFLSLSLARFPLCLMYEKVFLLCYTRLLPSEEEKNTQQKKNLKNLARSLSLDSLARHICFPVAYVIKPEPSIRHPHTLSRSSLWQPQILPMWSLCRCCWLCVTSSSPWRSFSTHRKKFVDTFSPFILICCCLLALLYWWCLRIKAKQSFDVFHVHDDSCVPALRYV